ncbi:MAG TPA: ABC transporter substrate-binding protein, partial [Acidimicrobiales bacterium]
MKTRTGTIRRATRIGALGVGAVGLFLGLVSSGIGEVATASAASSSKSPVTIGLLWDIKGESSVDINDYQNGAMLAVKQLNKAGGVGGRKVIVFRQP